MDPVLRWGSVTLQAAALIGAADNPAPSECVWVDDAVPAGATVAGNTDVWNWVASNPAPYSGSLAHQSGFAAGEHQHYFYNATTTVAVGVGEALFTYVYLDPANPPSGVMLQWNDGSWEHRAYWGANLIWGERWHGGRRYVRGALPAVGQWVRSESCRGGAGGLEGRTLNGTGVYSVWGTRHLGPCW